jgi:pSer/pThr/pTyr-binding forkhead associated (FHA) protein
VDGKFILTDLNSANGTFVNGVKVTKTELMDRDVISVGKHNLIFELNAVDEEEAIGEAFGANRTVIVENTSEGVLRIAKGKNKGQEFRITKYETTLGRAPENDVVINDWFVSKAHAKILRQGSNYVLKDLGSWKGTFVNETQVKEPTNLREGDEIRMGSTKLVFSVFDEKKQLQVEMRRPQELSYDESGDRMPPPMAAAAAPSSPSHQVVRREPEAATESPLPPPLPRKRDVEQSLGSPDHITRDGVPRPPVPAAEDDDLNFEDLPEPTLMDTNIAAAMEKMRAQAANASAPQAAVAPAVRPVAPPPASASPAASWQDFGGAATPAPVSMPIPAAHAAAAAAPADASSPALDVSGSDDPDRMAKQIAMWEKALQNKSPLIRKQAAKMLKKLTGKDYEV